MKKSRIVVFLLIVGGFRLFAGGTQEVKNAQPAQAPAAKPAEIKVLIMASAAGTGLDGMIQDFESRNPHIKVRELTYAPAAGYDTKVELELAAGGGAYDVIWVTGRSCPSWSEENWILDLGPIIKDPKMTDPAEFNFNDFVGGAIRFLTVNGKLHALPILSTAQVMFYRGDIFEKAGIASPPDTWDELMEVARKIHTPEVGAIGMRGSRERGGVMWTFPQVLYGFGGRIVKDFPNDMHPVFDSPEAIKAAEYYAKILQDYGFKGTLSAQYKDVSTAMQQGKMAILIDGFPGVGPYEDPNKSTVSGKLRYHYVPGGPAGRWPAFGAHGLSIPTGSKNREAAWEFIKWTLSTERQLRAGIEKNEIGLTRKSVLTHPDYLKKFNYADGELMRKASETMDAHVRSFYRPMTAEWGEVEDITALALSKVLSSQESAEKALKEANREIYRVYREAGYIK